MQNFLIFFTWNVWLIFSRNRLKRNFANISAFFSSKQKPFSLETLLLSDWMDSRWIKQCRLNRGWAHANLTACILFQHFRSQLDIQKIKQAQCLCLHEYTYFMFMFTWIYFFYVYVYMDILILCLCLHEYTFFNGSCNANSMFNVQRSKFNKNVSTL